MKTGLSKLRATAVFILPVFFLSCIVSTSYAVQGKDCSEGGCSFNIDSFSNKIKSGVGNVQNVKERLKRDLGYDPDPAARNPRSVPDRSAADSINQILEAIRGASSIEFTCTERRVISVKVLYRCTWNENLFPTMDLCRNNCVEQGVCKQTPCYGTAYCSKLSKGYVCPLNMERCNATPSCPPGGTYNAQTGKCEAKPL